MNNVQDEDGLTPEQLEEEQKLISGEFATEVLEPEEPEEPEEPRTIDVVPEFNKGGRICNFHIPFRPDPPEEFDLGEEGEERKVAHIEPVEPAPMPEVERTYTITTEEFSEKFSPTCGRKYKIENNQLVYDESLPMAQPDLVEVAPLKGPAPRR